MLYQQLNCYPQTSTEWLAQVSLKYTGLDVEPVYKSDGDIYHLANLVTVFEVYLVAIF